MTIAASSAAEKDLNPAGLFRENDNPPCFIRLLEKGAAINRLFLCPDYSPAFSKDDLGEDVAYDTEKNSHKTTCMIHFFRSGLGHGDSLAGEEDAEDEAGHQGADPNVKARFEKRMRNVQLLLNNSAKLNVPDSDGRDIFMHAAIGNQLEAINILIKAESNANPLPTDCQDLAGRSAMHYAVQPLKFGSYENTDLLLALHRAGFANALRDKDGLTPAHYAKQ